MKYCKIPIAALFFLVFAVILSGCQGIMMIESLIPSPDAVIPGSFTYRLLDSHQVDGRQGIACDGENYYVSGSLVLLKYDENWKLIAKNDHPFDGTAIEVDHLADIDVYGGDVYACAELFRDGRGTNIQMLVYDGNSLELKRSLSFEPDSGQLECSGIAVDPDHQLIWMSSWAGEDSGRYLYKYDLRTGIYMGKVHLQPQPQWIQGIAYHEGFIYITADDGTADLSEADHLYKIKVESSATSAQVTLEKTFDDVVMQGEIEGLTMDTTKKQLLILYNRGQRILNGMPADFYEGYDREISEIYIYKMKAKTEGE